MGVHSELFVLFRAENAALWYKNVSRPEKIKPKDTWL